MTRKLSAIAASIAFALSATNVLAQDSATSNDTEADYSDIEVIKVESTRGLISYVSATGSKSDVPIVETPLSVSVLTTARLEDLGALTIQDAIGYVAGLYNGPYGIDTRVDSAKIRGVAPQQYQDGLKSLFGNYNNVRSAPYTLQQIEILKGPSSVLYGQGSTGGIINLVSKRPQAEPAGEIWAQLGNFSRKQLAADFTGALNQDASLQGRIVALYRDSDTQTDYVEDNSRVINPSLSWQVDNDTKITLIGNFQRNESGSSTQFFPWQGTLLPNEFGPIDSSRFMSEPDFDRYDTEQDAITAIVEHDINYDWRLRFATRYSDSHADYRTIYGWPPVFQDDNRSIQRLAYISDADARSWTSDLQLHGTLLTGAVEHKLTFGIDFQDAYTDSDTVTQTQIGLLDVYDPVYGQAVNLPTLADVQDMPSNKNYQLGFYAQDNMRIADKWIVSAALRRDRTTANPEFGAATDQYATTGRLGVMYLFEGGISPYLSYSESFSPLLGTDAYGNSFKPIEGEQWEAGVKFQPQGTEHLITASVYQIKELNRQTPLSAEQAADPAVIDPNGRVQIGEAEVKGVELEAQLAWDELDIYASYAYTDTEITESNTVGELGAKLSATPEQQASLWATYRPQQLQGFKVGAGARFVGNTWDGSAYVEQNGVVLNQPLETASYTLFDAMIGYDWANYSVSLHANNLTDKTVVTSCLARGDCFYGEQRTITANFKYHF
ncbi:TonB-dependent siderophore receptor [Idiomarina xiamenensis]|uniref:TonB-dependent siderophore receptor n=1 Tax=Idiomarina xiamenensis 10-D-4 TaxID=740709 RepID=K2K9G7_9GAMM|nr:TonB-dependent siderophore receptor [Idiomarina xiamenensis]EKE84433.1 hypothetical protein A10D4_05177 [Idiomarina xiamenensis 10-D-4]